MLQHGHGLPRQDRRLPHGKAAPHQYLLYPSVLNVPGYRSITTIIVIAVIVIVIIIITDIVIIIIIIIIIVVIIIITITIIIIIIIIIIGSAAAMRRRPCGGSGALSLRLLEQNAREGGIDSSLWDAGLVLGAYLSHMGATDRPSIGFRTPPNTSIIRLEKAPMMTMATRTTSRKGGLLMMPRRTTRPLPSSWAAGQAARG